MDKKIIAALVFIISSASAQPVSYVDVCGVDDFNASSGDALSFIAIAFGLVSAVIALAYMFSRFRQDAVLSTWAKDEAANLLISVLLFAGLLIFFTGSCRIAEGYVGQSPIVASQNYLKVLIQQNGMNVLRTLTSGSINNQLDATRYLYVGFTPFFGSGVAGSANLRAHSAHKEFLIDLYLPLLASLNAQYYFMQAIQWIGAAAVLPFAFVLRLIPFTREFGNLFIAIFFGIYIVVPSMYAMSGAVFADITDPSKPIYTVNSSLNNFYSYGIDQSGAGKGALLYQIGSTIPQAVFLPNLVIIVTITTITALSKALRAIAV